MKKIKSSTIQTMIRVTEMFLHDTSVARRKYWETNSKSSVQSDFYDTAEQRGKELLDKLKNLHESILRDEKV